MHPDTKRRLEEMAKSKTKFDNDEPQLQALMEQMQGNKRQRPETCKGCGRKEK